MYRRRGGQINALESQVFFGGVELDPSNQWVHLAEQTPWEYIEEKYARRFEGVTTGNPAKPSRMAVGTLIIKERYQFSDDDTLEEIRMNPYLQYYIGLPSFRHEAPFHSSTITRFRQRVTPEMLQEINDIVIGRIKTSAEEAKDPPEEPPSAGGGSSETGDDVNGEEEQENEGTMILDATCAPQNIRFPTDISLLNEAREKLEGMIDALHASGMTEGKKPRTYRKRARWDYLRYARNRKPSLKLLNKSIRKQLGYVARDLLYLKTILGQYPSALSDRQATLLATIHALYEQQREMYDKGTHTARDRIVSLSQPHVRPIVRGKVSTPVEFGAKIEMSMVGGFARIEQLSWNAFNEGCTLQESVERFKADTGHYPARILADKLFRTRENLAYCKKWGIRMSGPKLGRPPKDKAIYREQQRIERDESGERSAIECEFGVGKRRYSLGLIMTRMKHTSEVAIHITVLTMNLFRKLRLSFVSIFGLGRKITLSSVSVFFSLVWPLVLGRQQFVAFA